MTMTKKEIETLIKESIPDAIITIEDLRGDGNHYSATIISKSFQGKSHGNARISKRYRKTN